MKIPATYPHFKAAVALVGLYAAIWMALEGSLGRDLLLAASLMAMTLFYLSSRYLGGRALPAGQAVALTTTAGMVYGVGLVLLTLFLMALKTGMHAHGPEYAAGEIAWVWRQLGLWSGAGALIGLGLGLLAVAIKRE